MLDGMDGLAGGLSMIALIAVGYLTFAGNLHVTAAASLVFIGAIGAFLVFNFPTRFNRRIRCFMGDAGSTLLGFIVVALCIRVSQRHDAAASPVTMLWLVALPLYELIWSTVRRFMRGGSPFVGDRRHFHYLLLRAGFGPRTTFGLLILMAAGLATFSILLHRAGVHDAVSFALFMVSGAGVVLLMQKAYLFSRLIPAHVRAVAPLDSTLARGAPAAEPTSDRLAA